MTTNRFFILFLFFSIMTSCSKLTCSSKKTVEEKHDNGSPQKKYQVVEKKDGSLFKDGYYKEWFSNGQISESGQYNDNLRTGKWRIYYSTGNLKEEGEYKKDQKVGNWSYYAENSQILELSNYNSDELDGLQKEWYPDGQKKSEKSYVKGKEHGTLTTWNQDGTIRTAYIFEYGNNITLVGTWINNVNKRYTFYKDGVYIEIDSVGNKISDGRYFIRDEEWNFGGSINNIQYMTNKEYRVVWPSNGSIFTGKKIN